MNKKLIFIFTTMFVFYF